VINLNRISAQSSHNFSSTFFVFWLYTINSNKMKFTTNTALAVIAVVSFAHTSCGFVHRSATKQRLSMPSSSKNVPVLATTGLYTRSSSSLSAADDDEDGKSMESVHQDADVIFSIIDKDGNGYLTLEELTSHLKPAGYTEQVIQTIFTKIDYNKDGQISRQEFQGGMVLFAALQSAPGLGNYNAQFEKEIHEDADQVFQSLDADGNGSIDVKELKDHLGRKFDGFSDAAIARIFLMLDFDGNKGIDKEELRDAFVRFSALRQAIGEGPNYK